MLDLEYRADQDPIIAYAPPLLPLSPEAEPDPCQAGVAYLPPPPRLILARPHTLGSVLETHAILAWL